MDKRFNLKQRFVVIILDLLLLAELTYSIYSGQQDPENMTAIFLRSFIPLALATLLVAKLLIAKLRTRDVPQCQPLALALEEQEIGPKASDGRLG